MFDTYIDSQSSVVIVKDSQLDDFTFDTRQNRRLMWAFRSGVWPREKSYTVVDLAFEMETKPGEGTAAPYLKA